MSGIFITGTDTAVGKTMVTGLLARYLLKAGYTVITQKWIQTGSWGFPSDIAVHLEFMGKRQSDIEDRLDDVCPCRLAMPASPHLAAENENARIDAARIRDSYKTLAGEFEFVLVEGVGGILVPYDRDTLVIDIAAGLRLPVIIVAKNRLGAINHTLLTIEAAKARGMTVLGVIFNSSEIQDDPNIVEDNPKVVASLTHEAILGVLPWSESKDKLVEAFEPVGFSILQKLKEEWGR